MSQGPPPARDRPFWHAPPPRRTVSLPRFPDPAKAALAATFVGLVLYAVLRFAVAAFYGPLGVDPSDVDGAAYPALLEQSIAAVGFLATFGGGLVVAVSLPAGLLAAGVHTREAPAWVRWALGVFGAVFVGVYCLVLWDVFGPKVALPLTLTTVALMLARPRIGVALVVLAEVALIVLVFAVLILRTASADAGAVRDRAQPEGNSALGATLPWHAWVASVSWPGHPPALSGVRLDCVLVLGSTSAGTLVYTTNTNGHRLTFVVPPTALVQRMPWLSTCFWPPERTTFA